MTRYIDLTGKRFNRLLVLQMGERSAIGEIKWICQCDCGEIRHVLGYQLRRGATQSCGCLNREINSKRSIGNTFGKTHGLTKHPLRAIRKAMIDRCYNEKNPYFKNYGGRGISVCFEWRESYVKFYEWGVNSGWIKGLSIDRIDNDGNYTPENCRWITVSENSKKNCVLGKNVGKGRKKTDNPTK